MYKRVTFGVTLNATALLLALLVLDVPKIGTIMLQTTLNPDAISLVTATFGIMLLNSLYRETKVIDVLCESLSRLVKNSKLLVSMIPAIIGLLPVPGGALMSAPLVEAETEKLGLTEDKKTYVNLWFRHVIFPIHPVAPALILLTIITGTAITTLVLRQIPVAISMVIVGYLVSLYKTPKTVKMKTLQMDGGSELKRFTVTFSPFLVTIITVLLGVNIALAAFLGVAVLLFIGKPKFRTFIKPLKDLAIWKIALAAYGAFLLRNVAVEVGISQVFSSLLSGASIHPMFLLIVIPPFLSILSGTPLGGVGLSVPVLTGLVSFTPENTSLLYLSCFLGYVASPTHLCLIFTAEYFKCQLGKLYKYLIPSLMLPFAIAILVYHFI